MSDAGDIVIVKTPARVEEVYNDPISVKMDSLGQLIIEAYGKGMQSKTTYAQGQWASVSQVIKNEE